MGILDGVFGGAKGVTNTLHNLLGGSATIKIGTTTRDATTGAVSTTFAEYPVPFIPKSDANAVSPLSAPQATRNDLRERSTILTGTIPSYGLTASIRPELDRIVYGGVEFLITAVEVVNVGDTTVQYSLAARKV